jgi:hypothetical protein
VFLIVLLIQGGLRLYYSRAENGGHNQRKHGRTTAGSGPGLDNAKATIKRKSRSGNGTRSTRAHA